MWGAIIQAIDHAMGRAMQGAGAGIKVAAGQGSSGSAGYNAGSTSFDSGKGDKAEQIASQIKTGKTGGDQGANPIVDEQAPGSETPGSGKIAVSQDEGSEKSAGGIGGVANIAGSEGGGIGGIGGGADAGADAGGEVAEDAADAAGSIVSDEKAKDSERLNASEAASNTVSKWHKAREYGANVANSIGNAGSIATGKSPALKVQGAWENKYKFEPGKKEN